MSSGQVEILEVTRKETGRVLFGLWRSRKNMGTDDWDHTGAKIREDSDSYESL